MSLIEKNAARLIIVGLILLTLIGLASSQFGPNFLKPNPGHTFDEIDGTRIFTSQDGDAYFWILSPPGRSNLGGELIRTPTESNYAAIGIFDAFSQKFVQIGHPNQATSAFDLKVYGDVCLYGPNGAGPADCRNTWSTGGASQWTTDPNGINYTDGKVGIGTPAITNAVLSVRTNEDDEIAIYGHNLATTGTMPGGQFLSQNGPGIRVGASNVDRPAIELLQGGIKFNVVTDGIEFGDGTIQTTAAVATITDDDEPPTVTNTFYDITVLNTLRIPIIRGRLDTGCVPVAGWDTSTGCETLVSGISTNQARIMTCPDNYMAINGGGECIGDSHVKQSSPNSSNRKWNFSCAEDRVNGDTVAYRDIVQSTITCVRIQDSTPTVGTVTVSSNTQIADYSLPNGGSKTVSTTCSAGVSERCDCFSNYLRAFGNLTETSNTSTCTCTYQIGALVSCGTGAFQVSCPWITAAQTCVT
ncbi:MAG TPA: hypothetical protein VFF13_06465 [archaeon]|nr:hypothetical protein [archaeon]